MKAGSLLAEPDRQEILKETKIQEQTLDAISSALDDMTRMGKVSNVIYCIHIECFKGFMVYGYPLRVNLPSKSGTCSADPSFACVVASVAMNA